MVSSDRNHRKAKIKWTPLTSLSQLPKGKPILQASPILTAKAFSQITCFPASKTASRLAQK